MQYRAVPLAVVAALIAACGGPEADRPDGSTTFLPDGGQATPPRTPQLDAVPTPVPWPIATLRGRADMAKRVIVEGAGNPIATTVLPDGSFCVDVPMPEPMTYSMRVFGQNEGGLSASAATVEVVFDPSAPPLAGVTTCSGADPAGCAGTEEYCGNGIDDDCNGLRDERDPACASCMDDLLEPNDDASAPRIEPGRYDDLTLCPGTVDFYGIHLRAGDTLRVRLFFTHAAGDLDMQLLGPDGETPIAQSLSADDDELIDHVAEEEGEYHIRVYGVGDAGNDYSMDVEVVRAT